MRIASSNLFDHLRQEGVKADAALTRVMFYCQRTFTTLWLAVNGNLSFGTSAAPDNIAGKWMLYTTNAVADTEDEIEHNLGVIPTGFIQMIPPEAGFITRGPTAWTTTAIYLKCSEADQTATLFLTIPPRT